MEELQRVLREAAVGRFGAARARAEGVAGPVRDLARCVLAAAGLETRVPSPSAIAPAHRVFAFEPLFHLALASFDASARDALLALRGDDDAPLWTRMVLWDRVVRGDDVGAEAEALYRRASERSDSATVVEAMVIRVWSAVAIGDLDEALRLARLASRMASSERLLVPECLAHVALAHVRRLRGSPHLAARILSTLRETVPRPWHAWIDLELGLVATGGDPCVAEVLDAARSGDRARLAHAADALDARCAGFAPLAREAKALREACDPSAPATHPFVRGEEPSASFLFADPGDAEGHLAYVFVGDGVGVGVGVDVGVGVGVGVGVDRGSRRVLASGTALCGPDVPRVGDASAQAQRTLVLLCDLALHGPSDVADVFERIYGFAYVPSRHAGAFRVTLHRARASVEGLTEVHREGDRLMLVPRVPFLIVDPRCRLALDERVLAILGHRSATVAELAASVGVTPRAIQKVMQRLTAEGVCEAGDDHAFRVIDTTFTEPSYEVDSVLLGGS